MRNQLLLLEDVEEVGRSGDIVSVKPGFARNFLLPKKKAVVADKFTLRMQAKLKEERAKRAEVDRKDSEETAKKLEGFVLSIEVKVDPDGHMYGSVTALDIVQLLEKQGIHLERRNVILNAPIKELGSRTVTLKLKEGVPASITLQVVSDVQLAQPQPAQEVDAPQQ